MRTHPLALDVGEACIGPQRCCSILSFCPRSSTTSHALCTLWSLRHPLRRHRLMTGYMPHRKRRTATTCRLSPINKQVASIGAAPQDNELLQNVLVDLQALSAFLRQEVVTAAEMLSKPSKGSNGHARNCSNFADTLAQHPSMARHLRCKQITGCFRKLGLEVLSTCVVMIRSAPSHL